MHTYLKNPAQATLHRRRRDRSVYEILLRTLIRTESQVF